MSHIHGESILSSTGNAIRARLGYIVRLRSLTAQPLGRIIYANSLELYMSFSYKFTD